MTTTRKATTTTSLAMAVVVLLSLSVYGETTIGRWCDRMIPNMPKYNHVMAIVVTDEGKVVVRSSFGDGSTSTKELRERAGGIYEKINSPSGDKYRVVPTTGNLQLLDNAGLIRTATRLENTPQRGECR